LLGLLANRLRSSCASSSREDCGPLDGFEADAEVETPRCWVVRSEADLDAHCAGLGEKVDAGGEEVAGKSPSLVIVFDQILLGESPATSFQISNGGDQPLSVTGMTWRNRIFSVSPNVFKVPIGSAANITVGFRPTATGAIRDTLLIASNDPAGPSRMIFLIATVVDYRAKQAYPLDANTIALYHFDETEGATVNDANTNKHNGQLANAPERIAEGYFSRAVRFNGLNQYGVVPQSEDIVFDHETRSYTLECFFRTDTI
jgi:hypothetical protein